MFLLASSLVMVYLLSTYPSGLTCIITFTHAPLLAEEETSPRAIVPVRVKTRECVSDDWRVAKWRP